jgi:Peptidase inhibitor family I36
MRLTTALRALTPIAALCAAGWFPASGHAAGAVAAECPVEEVCVWSGAGYTGTVTVIQDETCDTAPVGSALDNDPDTLQELRVYPQPGCGGAPVVLRSHGGSAGVSGRSYQNWHDPSDPAGP